jgi:drug/metabolite transporter (DMT)-like permease
MMVYLFSLLSAFTFALGLTLQQRGTLQTAAPEGDPRFLRQVLRKPVWLLGSVLLFCGWLSQATALRYGSLALVQSLQALSLVFALALGRYLTHQPVGRRSYLGALTTLLGIILLVTLGQPHGGVAQPAAARWWISGFLILALMSGFILLARSRRGAVPAALFSTAAGLAFAFQAAATKMLVIQLGRGLPGIFVSWPLYVLIAAELGGFALQQSALKTGFLAPATAALNAATLAASVVLGVAVFEESLSHGSGRMSLAVVGLIIAIVGVVTLATPAQRGAESGVREARPTR